MAARGRVCWVIGHCGWRIWETTWACHSCPFHREAKQLAPGHPAPKWPVSHSCRVTQEFGLISHHRALIHHFYSPTFSRRKHPAKMIHIAVFLAFFFFLVGQSSAQLSISLPPSWAAINNSLLRWSRQTSDKRKGGGIRALLLFTQLRQTHSSRLVQKQSRACTVPGDILQWWSLWIYFHAFSPPPEGTC